MAAPGTATALSPEQDEKMERVLRLLDEIEAHLRDIRNDLNLAIALVQEPV